MEKLNRTQARTRAAASALRNRPPSLTLEKTVARIEAILPRFAHVSSFEVSQHLAKALTNPIEFYRHYSLGLFDEDTGAPPPDIQAEMRKVYFSGGKEILPHEQVARIIEDVLNQTWPTHEGPAVAIAKALAEGKSPALDTTVAQVPEAKTRVITVERTGGRAPLEFSRDPSGVVQWRGDGRSDAFTPEQLQALITRTPKNSGPGDLGLRGTTLPEVLWDLGVPKKSQPKAEIKISNATNGSPRAVDRESFERCLATYRQAPGLFASSIVSGLELANDAEATGPDSPVAAWLKLARTIPDNWRWSAIAFQKTGAAGTASIVVLSYKDFLLKFEHSDGGTGVAFPIHLGE